MNENPNPYIDAMRLLFHFMARSAGYDPTLPGSKPGVLPAKLTPIMVAGVGIEPTFSCL